MVLIALLTLLLATGLASALRWWGASRRARGPIVGLCLVVGLSYASTRNGGTAWPPPWRAGGWTVNAASVPAWQAPTREEVDMSDTAYVQITSQSEVATCWLAGHQQFDVMALVCRDNSASNWQGVARFRYHDDARVWDSSDRKTGWRIEPTTAGGTDATRDDLVNKMDQAMRMLAETTGAGVDRIEVYGSGDDFFDMIKQHPGIHIKREPR